MAAKEEPQEEPKARKPKVVDPFPDETRVLKRNYTVTTTVDKNGAGVTCVEGISAAEDNTPVRIHVGERVFGGGTVIGGAFRAFIPATDEKIKVIIDGAPAE